LDEDASVMIEIKRLGEERWREVRDLRLEALEREPAAFCSAYKREATMDEEGWRRRTRDTLFAVSDGRPVGMIALGSEEGQGAGGVALLYGVYVRRESRGQGIGRRLVEGAIEAICENPEVHRIELTVNASQAATIRTYEKCGFVRAGPPEGGAGSGCCEEILMEKQIAPSKRR
ncbi:MAG TPA: GNAT family N-acetyltransferase, partial [Candidatus Methanomethylicus sp.]|nr:GNAT family N-acetyltransferase [Candidatus Methanomethylicus sp.]